MTLTSLRDNNVIRIPTILLFTGLLALGGFCLKFQRDVDAGQDAKIENRIRVSRYTTDQKIVLDWLKRVEQKLDKVIEK